MPDFTPGPWQYCGCGKCGFVHAPSSNVDVAKAFDNNDHDLHAEGVPSVSQSAKVANARLIAEGPEMWNVLQSLAAGRSKGLRQRAREILDRVDGEALR